MSRFCIINFMTVLLACFIILEQCYGQTSPRRRPRMRNPTSNGEGLPPNLHAAYQTAVGGDDSQSSQTEIVTRRSLWEEFVPSTPPSDAVECHVEVYMLRRQGGRCTRLGGVSRPYICQSGQHFEFNPDCARIIEDRDKRVPES